MRDGRAEDATRQPEQIKAFRDTWKLGIHSYLSYWRDRLVMARELLTETGSVFVQIGDENVHLVRSLMDEVFGSENFFGMIQFNKTGGFAGTLLALVTDTLVWYSKDKTNTKYRPIYTEKRAAHDAGQYDWVELRDGAVRPLADRELDNLDILPDGSRVMAHQGMASQGVGATFPEPILFHGTSFPCPASSHWKTTAEGITRLIAANRLFAIGKSIRYKRYLEDFPALPINNVWMDMSTSGFGDKKRYVVQTNIKVIERCILMTTDPGDLVLDPTCVRKGTRVYAPPPPSPRTGRELSLRMESEPSLSSNPQSKRLPSPRPRGDYRGAYIDLVPIEDIKPGQYVMTHDGKACQVQRLIRRNYKGQMVGLHHALHSETIWLTADHRVLAKLRPRTLGGHRDWSGSPPEHLERSHLRREATPTERQLWAAVRQDRLGFKFRRQHPVGRYIADFYCREAHLVVEIDGDTHYTEDAILYDAERDAHMRSLGLDVLRFTTTEVAQNLPGVCLAIQNQCRLRTQSTEDAQWVQAGALEPGDLVFFGVERQAVPIDRIETCYTEEEVYDLEIEGSHSFVTEVCAVHNCGSGTTAYVAEQWGRRWITIDTSRVAIALARTRLMSARFPYYFLADTAEGVKKEAEVSGISGSSSMLPTEGDIKKGFVYKRVPHVTLKSIANNPDIRDGMTREQIDAAIARHADTEILYDQPYMDNKVVRVTGPFTVESLSPHRVLATEDERPRSETVASNGSGPGQFETMILENLRKAGVQNTIKNERLNFDVLQPYAGLYIQGEGEYEENNETRRVAVCIGPEHATVGAELVKEAAKEAVRGIGFDLLVVCGFAFDPHVSEETKQYGKLTVLTAKINPDLQMGDEFLKRTGAGNLFMVFGEPDIEITKSQDGKLTVEINGLDVYDPTTGQVRSHSTDDIACWFIDTDYNEEAFFVRHAYFSGGDEPYDRLKRALKAEIDEEAWAALYSSRSRPFDLPKTSKIAVKVINHYGDEVLKVYTIT